MPAVEFVLEALDVPAAAAIDVVGRLASRSLVIVEEEGASPPVTNAVRFAFWGSEEADGEKSAASGSRHPA